MGDEKTKLGELLEKVGKTEGYKYIKDRIEDELESLYKETIGEIIPSVFGDLPMSILKAVVDDEKFWNETIFIGISNYVKSKKKPITEILNLLENDLFKLNNFGSDIVRQTLAGNIPESEKNEFYDEPIKWLRDWLDSDNNITVDSTDDVKHSINNIVFAILILIVLFLIFYLIFKRPKLNIGGSTKIIIENIFNNIQYNDNTITGGLVKGVLNVVDSWVNGDEQNKLLKNSYILLNEINKIAKSVGYLNTSLTHELTDDELKSRKFKVRNERINNELTAFSKSIGDNASKITHNLLNKGGLWKGDKMDYILADLIYARVKIKFEDEKPLFLKREGVEIIDWTDKESRKQHPLSKTVKKLNNITKGEIESSTWRTLIMESLSFTNSKISEIDRSNFIVNEALELLHYNKKLKKRIGDELKKIKPLSTSNDTIEIFKKEINAIINEFTFEDFYKVFGVDFIVSGSNITSAQPVFFNTDLTPSMPVVKAVRISSNFPFLFQPIKLKHSEEVINPEINFAENENIEVWVKNKEDYYKRNYSGFFIDGGLLNNFPMNAFNNYNSIGDLLRDPKSKLDLPPNNKVFGLKLGGLELENSKELEKIFKLLRKNTADGEDKRLDHYSHDEGTGLTEKIALENPKFTRVDYKYIYPEFENYQAFTKSHIDKKSGKLNGKGLGIISIITKMFGTTLDDSMDGRNSAFFDRNEQIVRLYTGRISLFDLVTKESELTLVDLFSYSEIYKHFNKLESMPIDWEKDLIKRLKRNTFLKNKWQRETRNRLKLKRRHF